MSQTVNAQWCIEDINANKINRVAIAIIMVASYCNIRSKLAIPNIARCAVAKLARPPG